jgi:adenosylmethionine-8-amino-7-oxononanoate aminotransferase
LFQKEKTLERLRPKIHWMVNALQEFYEIPQVGEIRTRGFIAALEIVKNPTTKEPFPYEQGIGPKVVQEARKRGAILRTLGDVVVLMPPLGIPMPDLKKLMKITQHSIQEVLAGTK